MSNGPNFLFLTRTTCTLKYNSTNDNDGELCNSRRYCSCCCCVCLCCLSFVLIFFNRPRFGVGVMTFSSTSDILNSSILSANLNNILFNTVVISSLISRLVIPNGNPMTSNLIGITSKSSSSGATIVGCLVGGPSSVMVHISEYGKLNAQHAPCVLYKSYIPGGISLSV